VDRSSQPLSPPNDSSIMGQQYQQLSSSNQPVTNLLFATLSPPNTSASTSPNSTTSPNTDCTSFHTPIFGGQNMIFKNEIMNNNMSQQRQTNTSNIWTSQDNGSVGMLNTFNGDIDAKLVNNYNDDNNIYT